MAENPDDTFDAIFVISALTLIIGCSATIFKYFLKSKCKTMECCCLKIERDVEAEEKIEEERLHLGLDRNNTMSSKNNI